MSTNTYMYSAREAGIRVVRMNIADLTVGQRLVRRVSGRYDRTVSYQDYIIVKILPSRLVIKRATDAAGANNEVRILVATAKEYGTTGEVKDNYEGSNSRTRWGMGAARYYLFTEDDAVLAHLRERDAETIEREASQAKMREAVEMLQANIKSGDFTQVDAIDKAIALLQSHRKFITDTETEDK